MHEPAPRYRFTPAMRLHSKRDFDQVFALRRRQSDAVLTVYVGVNPDGGVRLGIAVSRRHGNAVRRNRFKRLVREAFRHLRPELPPGTDWIVLPQGSASPTLTQVTTALRSLTTRLARRWVLPATPP